MKLTLNWADLRALGHTDNGGRWHPNEDIAPYFLRNIRAPSRAWPHSYAKAAQTNKFVNWLFANRPEIAARFNFNGEV